MATKISNTNTEANKMKKYIQFPVVFDNGREIDYVVESEQGYSRKTGLFQLEGHLYVENSKSRTGYVQVNRWIWGMQPKEGVPKKDWTLWKTSGGEPIAWTSDKISDDFNIALAEAIMSAYKMGEGVIDCPFKKPQPAVKKQAAIKTANVFEAAPLPCDADAPLDIEEDENMQEDIAMLDGMGESPLARLNAGDPTFFTELGVSQGHARQWAKWIRENKAHFEDISDIIKVQGIGNKTANVLTAAFSEKYSA